MRTEPEAARLRRHELLWPENLTDHELALELAIVSDTTNPISSRMLRDEDKRRRPPQPQQKGSR